MSAPSTAPASGNDHLPAPAPARELAARLSALFERDVEIIERLNDAHHRLANANERLYPGLAPDAFGLLHGAAAAAITTSPIVALIHDGGAAAYSQVIEELQQIRWEIHRAFCAYQHASEQRRQLAVDVGEYSQQLTQALRAAGWSPQEAREANVHELAAATA
ncbi:MAG: hypothetical protein M3071_00345 [Actinomycetota bacterium]|nr:hypothetical protein [Actinomycetota bacterium]